MFLHFRRALKALGANDKERAQILGIRPRTLTRYRAGRLPPVLLGLMRAPTLLEALVCDANTQKERAA